MEPTSPHQQLDLVLYTAVDYKRCRGAGIGVVQRAEDASTGRLRNDVIPNQECKYSYSRQQVVVNNIRTATRAHMLALIHAIGLARRTARGAPRLRGIIIFSASPLAVHTVNYHLHNPDNLQNMTSTNDRLLTKNIVTRVRKLSHHGLRVDIAVVHGKDEAWQRANTMAKQGGRKSWRARCTRPVNGHPGQYDQNDDAHRAQLCLHVQNSQATDS